MSYFYKNVLTLLLEEVIIVLLLFVRVAKGS